MGRAVCFRVGDALAVPQIQVETAFRNLGIGSDLVRSICMDAREQDLRVLALSPFMRRWIQLHPQFEDVLRAVGSGELARIDPLAGSGDLHEKRRLPADLDGLARR